MSSLWGTVMAQILHLKIQEVSLTSKLTWLVLHGLHSLPVPLRPFETKHFTSGGIFNHILECYIQYVNHLASLRDAPRSQMASLFPAFSPDNFGSTSLTPCDID